jgi:hypothetical protein
MLVKDDVYVVDQFGAHEDGPTIGDNLGNSIYAKTVKELFIMVPSGISTDLKK